MNKILVLAKNKHTYFVKRLTQELGEGLSLYDPWSEEMVDKDFTKILVRTTGVYGRDDDLRWLKNRSLGLAVINPLLSLERFRQKDTQYNFFFKNELPVLPWLTVGETLESPLSFMSEFQNKEFVVKPLRGQGGWGIELVNEKNFSTWWEKGDHSYLIQPYLSGAQEWRVFFIAHDYRVYLRRTVSNGVTANFRQEGEAFEAAADSVLEALMDKIIGVSGVDYGAVDLLFHQGEWKILELNVVPGIEQLEKVTGKNIMWEIVDRLLKD